MGWDGMGWGFVVVMMMNGGENETYCIVYVYVYVYVYVKKEEGEKGENTQSCKSLCFPSHHPFLPLFSCPSPLLVLSHQSVFPGDSRGME